MPKPTDAHRKLERLLGNWRGEEKIFPTPWDPKGGTAKARAENRGALGGFIVVQEYEQEREGTINFRGHGVFSWDPAHQCYIMTWFDTMGMPPTEFKGNFMDNILTLTNQNPQGQSEAIFDFRQEGKYSFRMEVSQDGKQWVPFMEGNYRKEGS